MKYSSRMQGLIQKMAETRGADLGTVGTHWRAKSGAFMDLVVETIGRNCISIAHYYIQNGDMCQDPEIVFWMCPLDGNWYPIEWTTPPFMLFGKVGGGYDKVLWLDPDGTVWEKANVRAQAGLAKFANQWSTNLRRQGFA